MWSEAMLTIGSTTLGVLLAFLLNSWWINRGNKKEFKEMIVLVKYELENNKTCIQDENWVAISFETFKALSANPLFIRYITPGTFNALWKTTATLRVMKDAKIKNKIPSDLLMKKWFDGEIDISRILDIVIQKVARDGESD